MKKLNLLPFDLNIALKYPERVVTRDGRKVKEIAYFKKQTKQPLVALIGSEFMLFYIDGKFNVSKSVLDLFLLPEVKKLYVNVYKTKSGPFLGAPCETLALSKSIKNRHPNYIKTVCITDEPE